MAVCPESPKRSLVSSQLGFGLFRELPSYIPVVMGCQKVDALGRTMGLRTCGSFFSCSFCLHEQDVLLWEAASRDKTSPPWCGSPGILQPFAYPFLFVTQISLLNSIHENFSQWVLCPSSLSAPPCASCAVCWLLCIAVCDWTRLGARRVIPTPGPLLLSALFYVSWFTQSLSSCKNMMILEWFKKHQGIS